MYKNLNAASLGLTARQSELIELALTYHFKGLDIDIVDLQKRGIDAAKRFLSGTKLNLSFELPTVLAGDDATFKTQLTQLQATAQFAAQLGAKICTTHIQPASEELPFHANFEIHRVRLAQVADLLESHGIRLAVGFLAAESQRAGKYYQFIYQADQAMMLLQAVPSKNISLLLDTWNWVVGGGTIEQIKKLKPGQIGAVRLADVPAEKDVATLSDDNRLLPEEAGVVDMVAILQHVAETGYEGPITIYPHASRCGGLRRDALVQRVSSLFDEKMKAIAGSPAGAES